MRIVFLLLCCCGLFFNCQPEVVAGQEVTLDAIDFDALDDGVETVTFTLSGENVPKIFMLTGDKPRLVLDFVEASYVGDPRGDLSDNNLVKGIRIGVHRQPQMKTRVVIDLAQGKKIKWNRRSNEAGTLLRVDISSDDTGQAEREKPVVAVPRPQKQKVLDPPETEIKEDGEEKQAAHVTAEKIVQEAVQEQAAEDTFEPETAVATPAPPVEKNAKVENSPQPVTAVMKPNPEKPYLLDVSFDGKSKKGEMIMFKLDDFHPPVVSAIEKGIPRIVCDFYNMRIAGKIKSTIEVDGQYVDKIRVARHENPGKVRAVLDLIPGNDYDLQQVFFNEDNLFVLIVNILDDGNGPATTVQ